MMSRIRTESTAPELAVRQLLSARGVRYRLNDARFPGRPDIFVPRLKLAVFVHGCFWHGHECRRGALPKTNAAFWSTKIAGNRRRDTSVSAALALAGISVITVWGCGLKTCGRVVRRIARAYHRATPISH